MAAAEAGSAVAALVNSSGLTGSLEELLTCLNSGSFVSCDALIDALTIVGASTEILGRPQQANSKAITIDLRSRRHSSQHCVSRFIQHCTRHCMRCCLRRFVSHLVLRLVQHCIRRCKQFQKSRRCRMKLHLHNLKNAVVRLSENCLTSLIKIFFTNRSNSSSLEERMKIFFAPTRHANGDVIDVMPKEAGVDDLLNIVELPSLMLEMFGRAIYFR